MSLAFFINRCSQYFYNQLSNILPLICLLCGERAKKFHLCHSCWLDLPSLAHYCNRCGQAIDKNIKMTCWQCQHDPAIFDEIKILFPYAHPINYLLTALKFNAQTAHVKFFSLVFIEKIPGWYLEKNLPDSILPVPLHDQRLAERGFNQALEIAKPIAQYFNIHLDTKGVIRIKATAPQTSLPSHKRVRNIKNAFKTSQNYTGKTIAILDDVMTTGHTLLELTRVLKLAKAKEVHVWCCARSQMPGCLFT